MNALHCRAILGCCACLLAVSMASAQATPHPAWEWKSDALAIEGGLDTYSAYYAMRGTWWNLAAGSAPTFDTDRSFAEL
jgi:hypothetical protein